MSENKISIAIVDDHPVVIEGLKALLQGSSRIENIYSFISGSELISSLKVQKIDIVLLDIMLPDGSGIDFCKEIKSFSPETMVLGLSNQAERSIIIQMLEQGASGYLLKNASTGELLRCIEEVKNGGIAFSKEVKEIMAKPSRYEREKMPSLTKREKQILQMIADGNTSQEIADALFLSFFTVETHRRNLSQKLKVKNVAGLIRAATELKLI